MQNISFARERQPRPALFLALLPGNTGEKGKEEVSRPLPCRLANGGAGLLPRAGYQAAFGKSWPTSALAVV